MLNAAKLLAAERAPSNILMAMTGADQSEARQQVDLTATETRPDRMRLQNAINGMFAVSDTLHEIVLVRTGQWFQEDTSLSTPVFRAVALTELHDIAGRMGSWLIAPVQTRMLLSDYNLECLYRADERVSILWDILTPAGAFPTVSNDSLARHAC